MLCVVPIVNLLASKINPNIHGKIPATAFGIANKNPKASDRDFCGTFSETYTECILPPE